MVFKLFCLFCFFGTVLLCRQGWTWTHSLLASASFMKGQVTWVWIPAQLLSNSLCGIAHCFTPSSYVVWRWRGGGGCACLCMAEVVIWYFPPLLLFLFHSVAVTRYSDQKRLCHLPGCTPSLREVRAGAHVGTWSRNLGGMRLTGSLTG